MSHIRGLSGRYSLFELCLRVLGMAAGPAGGGSIVLRKRSWLIGVVMLPAVLLALDAFAQPRGTSARAQQGPALPPSGHQTEPVDLNEGKSPAELFKAGCAVCHQSAAGLAKGRREGELVGFLRQHYTSSVQHAGALAQFLMASGRGAPPVAAPSRQERPPAPVGRRTPDEERREAVRPPEPSSRRKPPAAAARTPPSPPPPVAAVEAGPAEPEPVAEPSTPESAPPPPVSGPTPAEVKPPAPEIPL